jgi:hypothetical protein
MAEAATGLSSTASTTKAAARLTSRASAAVEAPLLPAGLTLPEGSRRIIRLTLRVLPRRLLRTIHALRPVLPGEAVAVLVEALGRRATTEGHRRRSLVLHRSVGMVVASHHHAVHRRGRVHVNLAVGKAVMLHIAVDAM